MNFLFYVIFDKIVSIDRFTDNFKINFELEKANFTVNMLKKISLCINYGVSIVYKKSPLQ